MLDMQVKPADLLNQAQAFKQKALDIMSAEDGDLEEADRLMTEAAETAKRSDTLTTLSDKAAMLTLEETIQEQQALNKRPDEGKESFKHFGQYLRAIKKAHKSRGAIIDPRLQYFDEEGGGDDQHALSESVGAEGGYLVPIETLPQLMAQAMDFSIVRSRATIIPMSRRQIQVPRLKQRDTTAGEPHWFGGMLVFWEGEAATIQETQQAFEMLDMLAYKLTAFTQASDELLADAAQSLSALISGPFGFPGAVAWSEDYAFLRGTGVGQPLGILNSGPLLTQARAGTGIAWEDLTGMASQCLDGGNYIWIANPALRATLMNMTGPTGNPAYLWGNAVEGQPGTLMGDPIFFNEKLPAAGSAGDLIRVDLSHYWIGDRQRTTIDISTEYGWITGQTAWKVTHRVGGRPWLDTPFTLADGTFQVSPFVQLGAESSS